MTDKPPEAGEVYLHYKGGEVVVESVSTHTETGETLVTYEHDGRFWTRPLSVWSEQVNGQPRFRLHGHTLGYIERHREAERWERREGIKREIERIRQETPK